jgi:hypothetical protein
VSKGSAHLVPIRHRDQVEGVLITGADQSAVRRQAVWPDHQGRHIVAGSNSGSSPVSVRVESPVEASEPLLSEV